MDLWQEFDLTPLWELMKSSVRCLLPVFRWGGSWGGWIWGKVQNKQRQRQKQKTHEEGQKTGCILVDSDIAVWGYSREEALHFGVNHAYQPQVV